MAGIPTSNILQPGAISITGGVNRALVSQLQLLTPQYYNKYVEKYGNEDFTWWLATFGGKRRNESSSSTSGNAGATRANGARVRR